MVTTLILIVVLGGSGAAGWVWWQGRVTLAAGEQLREAAAVQAALALSDPLEGGMLAWEAGMPAYHPAPESSDQERALLKAWEMTLRQELFEPPRGQKPLPLQLDECLPAMLPVANAALYTAKPRSLREVQSNMRALAATSVLMQRRAQSWLRRNSGAVQELAQHLSTEQGVEQVNLAQWRRRVAQARAAVADAAMPDVSAAREKAAVEVE